jgi:hypothetical protein
MNIWLSLKKHLLFLQDNLFVFSDFHSDISSAFQFLTPTFQIESSNLKVVTDKTVIDIWTIIFFNKVPFLSFDCHYFQIQLWKCLQKSIEWIVCY